jgi:hypothetical protein
MANKATQSAGLICNVNTVKAKLKEFYDAQGIAKPMFSGGHSAITAVLQKTFELILTECCKHVKKDKSGMRTVNREFVQTALLMHPGFNQYYVSKLSQFDPEQLYKDQVPISSTEMDSVITGIDSQLQLTPKARNMICYLLMKVFLDLAFTCSKMLEFAKKKSLDTGCVIHATAIKFSDDIAKELETEVTRVAKLLGEEVDAAVAENEDGSSKVDTIVADEPDDGSELKPKKTAEPKAQKEKAQKEKPVAKASDTKKKPQKIDQEDADPAEDGEPEPVETKEAEPKVEQKPKPTATKPTTAKPATAAKPTAAKPVAKK